MSDPTSPPIEELDARTLDYVLKLLPHQDAAAIIMRWRQCVPVKYALIIEGKAVKGESGYVMSKEGEEYIVCRSHDGWVEASGTSLGFWKQFGYIDREAMIFEDPSKAAAFVKRWKGHPWWVKPNGKFRLVPVEPVYGQPQGWKEVK